MLLVTSVLVVVGLLLYRLAPSLLSRSSNTTLSQVIASALAERIGLWGEGLDIFLSSPLWGVGFSQAATSHNLFISTLADQGLVGFVFLVGLFVFLIRQMIGIGRGLMSDERTVWRMAFVCLVIFCFLHITVSGAVYSSWEFFWGGAFLWLLRPLPAKVPLRRIGHGALRSAPPAAQESGSNS
jgi:O-antigen ligase